MLNCAILDDEEHALEVLSQHVGACDALQLIAATTSAVEALNLVANGQIDLLFLDINMPEISGIEVAKTVGNSCKIIFTTAYPEFALESYELGAADYLLKPVSYPRFLKAVKKATENMAWAKADKDEEADYFYVKTGVKNSVVKIAVNDIDYIEGLQNYVGIWHAGSRTLAYISLKEAARSLPEGKFIRVHKSFLVPFSRIVKIECGEILLEGVERPIVIGESYKAALWERVRNKTLGEGL